MNNNLEKIVQDSTYELCWFSLKAKANAKADNFLLDYLYNQKNKRFKMEFLAYIIFSLMITLVSYFLLVILKIFNLKIPGLPGDGLPEEIPLEGAIQVDPLGSEIKCFICKVNVKSGNVYSRECKRSQEGCYDMRMVCEDCAKKM